MQTWVVFCWALLALVGAEQCPGGGRSCDEGQTCCNDPENGYECCPLDQAECCADHTHCCPAGTTCDVDKSSCVNATGSVPWVERASADQPGLSKSFRMIKSYMGEEDDNVCPDQSRCPPEFSCLRALTRFGCCPLAQGVPCSDGKHCCPEGHQCSADSRSCIRKEFSSAVLCGDEVSECPEQTTCCETPEGQWGCCPMPKAVCCEDKLHCCPEGSTCNVQHLKCISSSTKEEMPMWAKLPARARAEWENKKEQVSAEEVDEKTPEGTAATPVPPSEEEAASVSSVTKGGDVPCDNTATCSDGTTCCKTVDGDWACCPLPEAVCCADHVHCCPKGKKCNLTAQTCDDDWCSVPLLKKIPALPRQDVQVEDVPCDSNTTCPDGSTCCKTKDGGWACCPLPQAVCCDDHEHCCPTGTACDLTTLTCNGPSGSAPMERKMPAFVALDTTTPSQEEEPQEHGNTKAQEEEGEEEEEEEEEEDGTHGPVPWVEKVSARPRQDARVEDVPCDSNTTCPDGSTCCKTKDGGWACCPLPQAVCCDDHEHCCPTGTACDLTTLTCNGPSGSAPMERKMPAFVALDTTTPSQEEEPQEHGNTKAQEEEGEEEEEEEDKEMEGRGQCDPHTSCPQHTTCCFMASSQKWGCCPLPEAVCCSDGDHCCPAHYKCNEHGTSCVRGDVVIPWYPKLPATTTTTTSSSSDAQADPSAVQCDGLNQCPERTTCCRLFTGAWGCCPLQSAVCCPDQEHCCPQGFSCHVGSGSCQKLVMLQLETVPLTPVYLPEHQHRPTPLQHRDVQCDAEAKCDDGETCCRMSAAAWGCCPSPNAVCCGDMSHCCPAGYTCVQGGVCVQNTGLHWHNWNMFLANKKRALIV